MLIYIMARGHSGSTILDILLGNSASIESIGSLMAGLMAEPKGHICACGAAMQACGYWQAVRRNFAEQSTLDWRETAAKLVAHTHVRNIPRTLFARNDSPEMLELARASTAISRAIAVVSGKPHMVESSKEPTRALMLLRFCDEARVIHLVRDPRRLMASHYWRFKKWGGYQKFLRRTYHAPSMVVPFMLLEAISWTVGGLLAEIARRFAPSRVLRVRYEDLCDAPAAEIGRIGAALGLRLDDLAALVEGSAPLMIGHNADGNQIRTETTVTFSPKKGTAHDLPRWLELATIVCCWPLMLRYGYGIRSSFRRPIVATRPG